MQLRSVFCDWQPTDSSKISIWSFGLYTNSRRLQMKRKMVRLRKKGLGAGLERSKSRVKAFHCSIARRLILWMDACVYVYLDRLI